MEMIRGCPSTMMDNYQLNISTMIRHTVRNFPGTLLSKTGHGKRILHRLGRHCRNIEWIVDPLPQVAYSGESVHVFRGKTSSYSEDNRPVVPEETVRSHRSVATLEFPIFQSACFLSSWNAIFS